MSSPSCRLTVWDGKTGRRLAVHAVPPEIVRLTISPGGTMMAAVDLGENVHLIDPRSGAVRRIVTGRNRHTRPPTVTFSPDGVRLAVAMAIRPDEGDPSPVVVWDLATGRTLPRFPGRSEEAGTVSFTPTVGRC